MRNTRRSSGDRLVLIGAQDANIKYDSTWNDSKVQQDAVKSTASPNGNSTATYTFHGNAIYLYGYTGPAGPPTPNIVCYVDDTIIPPSPRMLPGKEQKVTVWDSSTSLCGQDQLTDGTHTFKLVVQSASDAYPFMLDALQFGISNQQYEGLARNLEASVSQSADPSAATSSLTTDTPTSGTSNSYGTAVAPIVGEVLGAVVGLALTALGIYLVVRRRRQAYSKLVDEGAYGSPY